MSTNKDDYLGFRVLSSFFLRFAALARLAGMKKTTFFIDLVTAYGLQFVNDIKALKGEKPIEEKKVISTVLTVKRELSEAAKERAEKAEKKAAEKSQQTKDE